MCSGPAFETILLSAASSECLFIELPHGITKAPDACGTRAQAEWQQSVDCVPLFQLSLSLCGRLLSLSVISGGESLRVKASFSLSHAAPLCAAAVSRCACAVSIGWTLASRQWYGNNHKQQTAQASVHMSAMERAQTLVLKNSSSQC